MQTKCLTSIGSALAAGLIFCGCGTVLPTKSYVRRGPNYSTAMLNVNQLGILVDAAVAYDRVSTNYFDLEDSQAAISNLVREAQSALNAKGYQVAFVESPFVGAFKPADGSYALAVKRKDDPVPHSAPFQIADELNGDPAYRDALLRTSHGIIDAVQTRGELPTELLQGSDDTKAALAAVSTKKGIRYLLVIQGNGTIVSGGKQTGQEIGTALLSSVISMGQVVSTAHNVSLLDTYASLVDLQSAEVLWSNSLRLGGFNPANPDHYKGRWSNNVLYWLPPRGQLEPPPPK